MVEENVEYDESGEAKQKKGVSFTARITLSFAAIALMTALVAVGMLSFVWEQYFQSYTRENMENLAESVAGSIAQSFETTPNDWYSGALAAANSAAALYDTVSIQIVSADGSVVYNSGAHANFISPSLPENERNTASAPIVVDGEQVGTVFVRVFGSQTLLTPSRSRFPQQILSGDDLCFAFLGISGYSCWIHSGTLAFASDQFHHECSTRS